MSISANIAVDSDGNFMMRMSDNMAMDIRDVHYIFSWSDDEDD